MTPIPEPPGDIRAQLAAVLDPDHPKLACFLVPEDAKNLAIPEEGIPGLIVVRRDEGVLVTVDPERAELFRAGYDEPTMARILGYPECKDEIARRCPRPVSRHARSVQARDSGGHVVTEAFCSPLAFLPTCAAMARHVPPGGELVVMAPTHSIARRVALRWIGY